MPPVRPGLTLPARRPPVPGAAAEWGRDPEEKD